MGERVAWLSPQQPADGKGADQSSDGITGQGSGKSMPGTAHSHCPVIDGEGIFSRCGLGLRECSNSNPCPVHQDYKSVRENLFAMAQKFSLYDLAQKTEQGLFRLKV